MACANCIRAVEQGAIALFELTVFHADELPAGTDWRAVATQLRDLSITLKRAADAAGNTHVTEGNPQEVDRRAGQAPLREPGSLDEGPYGPC